MPPGAFARPPHHPPTQPNPSLQSGHLPSPSAFPSWSARPPQPDAARCPPSCRGSAGGPGAGGSGPEAGASSSDLAGGGGMQPPGHVARCSILERRRVDSGAAPRRRERCKRQKPERKRSHGRWRRHRHSTQPASSLPRPSRLIRGQQTEDSTVMRAGGTVAAGQQQAGCHGGLCSPRHGSAVGGSWLRVGGVRDWRIGQNNG